MDTQNLSIAIQAFIKKQSTNAAYYEENWNERKERKAYYQSFTKDKLLAMTEEDFLEYISRLWAVLMWGNKKYVVDMQEIIWWRLTALPATRKKPAGHRTVSCRAS